MSGEVLLEEFEVLESIYPTELSKSSERDIQIEVEPEELDEGLPPLKLSLHVHYTDDYPDALPDLSLTPLEGDVDQPELDTILHGLTKVGEENLGMAMTFTLVSHLREQIAELVQSREVRRKFEESEKERLALEAEELRTRGTPVTVESFKAWKAQFDKEQADRRAKEEEERLKGLTPKEREEYKRINSRLSGRQLFERNRNLDEETLLEEGTVSVDISQYERTREDEEEDEEHVTFSDSD
ncbi:ubiquitin-conjugating enzyme/RWD-like protein [Lentinula raphanica]|nr:RWD-domain-containing protein [Lentinula raphanica]KAJ3753827.1 ubiquitin-conjugating enzyme/RWD-like protein [Lentinula raphanica]KAJ3779339.1 ubiquitin-conjugating enzyme/RWD-like protein [Lentinula raphanica]